MNSVATSFCASAKVSIYKIPDELKKEVSKYNVNVPTHIGKNNERKSLALTLTRHPEDSANDYSFPKLANTLRRYLNANLPVLILDFKPNYLDTLNPVVIYDGPIMLFDNIRGAINSIVANQVASNEFELNVQNNTPYDKIILSESIKLKGAIGNKFHNQFSPDIHIATLKPGATLVIDSIFMKLGKSFSDKTTSITKKGTIENVNESTMYTYNGLCSYKVNDMLDREGNVKDPLTESTRSITIAVKPQPYIHPAQMFILALELIIKDLNAHLEHSVNAMVHFEKNIFSYKTSNFDFKLNGDDLVIITDGFDESLGTVIASVSGAINDKLLMYTSAYLHITKKQTRIRIYGPNSVKSFKKAIEINISRVQSILDYIVSQNFE